MFPAFPRVLLFPASFAWIPFALAAPLVAAQDDAENEPDILVSGRVVGPDGRPVHKAEVTLLGFVEEGGSPPPFYAVPPERWEQHVRELDRPTRRTETDHEGRFQLVRGPEVAAPALRVRADGLALARPLAFEPGQTDLVLRLTEAGALHLRWLEPAASSGNGAEVLLRDVHGHVVHDKLDPIFLPHDDLREHVFERRQGGTRHGGLLPGTYTVEFRWGQFEDRLGPVHEVTIVAGETSRPEIVELRPHLRRIPVTVLGEEGKPIASPIFATRGSSDYAGLPSTAGSLIVPEAASFDLVVGAWGHRPRIVEDLAGPAEVTLERGFEVTVRLGTPLPESWTPQHPEHLIPLLSIEHVADSSWLMNVPDWMTSPDIAEELGDHRGPGTVLFLTDDEGVALADEYPMTFLYEGSYLLRWIGVCRCHGMAEEHSMITVTKEDAGAVVELEMPAEVRELWE